ncbi:hypothetical protein JANAI62_23470 [Jannaschia pagri]|uniref:Uncharacterized protein n=1 Tax=Jannaschia pagri TaxID=2829797 RepID=A0ABQ4NMT6_9RHOB|nr:hypothetical protein JANAI61_23480 [Jannaschia sp. AI_61]GIT95724.1 hypothetical protein JANAI62_23470 [Jannaschia sp. AI_62]
MPTAVLPQPIIPTSTTDRVNTQRTGVLSPIVSISPSWPVALAIAIYISDSHNGESNPRGLGTDGVAGQTGRQVMFRVLKYLVILAVLGTIGLFGYSYLLEPESGIVTETIEIDAG